MSASKEIFASLRALTKIKVEQNKDTSVVKFIRSTVNAMDIAIKAIDKYLKSSGVDVGKLSGQLKDSVSRKGSWLRNKIQTLTAKTDQEDVPHDEQQGEQVKASLLSRLRGFTTSGTEPPVKRVTGALGGLLERGRSLLPSLRREPDTETSELVQDSGSVEESLEVNNELTDKGNSTLEKIVEKLQELIDKPVGEGDGDSKQPGWWGRRRERKQARQAEIEEEKKRAKEGLKKKEPSWLDKILKKIGWVAAAGFAAFKTVSTIGVKAIGNALWTGTKWLARTLGKVAIKGLKWLGPQILKGLKWLGPQMIKGTKYLASSVWKGLKWLGPQILKGTWKGLKWLGGKLLGGIGSVAKGIVKAPLKIVSGLKGILVGAFRGAVRGIGTLFSKSIGKVAGTLLKGLGGMASGIVGSVAKLIPGAGLAAKAGGILSRGLRLAGRALPAASRLARVAAPVLARGAAFVLTGPVGWVIGAASLAWEGYRLYKYITRNGIPDTPAGKLTRLRMISYGYNDTLKANYHKLFSLEEVVGPSITFNKQTGKVEIGDFSERQVEDIFEIFGISPEDEEKVALFENWFQNRFLKSYATFLQAMWNVNDSIKPGDVDKLKNPEIHQLLDNYTLTADVWNYTEIPTFDGNLSPVVRSDLDTVILALRSDLGENIASLTLQQATDRKLETQARDYETIAQREHNRRQLLSDNNQSTGQTNPVQQQRPRFNPMAMAVANDAEPDNGRGSGGGSPRVPNQSPNMAGGDLIDGDPSHSGIKFNTKEENLTNVHPKVYKNFTGMAKEFYQLTGKQVQLNEGFRSFAHQERLHRQNPSKAAPPGRSLHEHGLALDINTVDMKELEKLGLLRKYGFTASVGGETWHLEPIGVSLNPDASKKDPNFREQALDASPGRGGAGWGLVPNSRLYSRNIELQKNIFNTEVEPEEAPTGLELLSNVDSKPTSRPVDSGTPLQGLDLLSYKAPSQQPSTPSEDSTERYEAARSTPTPSSSPEVASYPRTIVGQRSAAMDLGSRSPNMPVMQAIKQASNMTGVDEETMVTFAKLESSLRPGVKASTSSATGLFQFTKGTWRWILEKFGKKYGLTPNADPTNPLHNSLMAGEYIKYNTRFVEKHRQAGIEKPIALYLAHFLGSGGARRFINAFIRNPNQAVRSVVDAGQYRANQASMGGRTLAQFLESIRGRWKAAGGTSAEDYSSATARATQTGSVISEADSPVNFEDYTRVTSSTNTPTLSNATYNPMQTTRPLGQTTDNRIETGPSAPVLDTSTMESIMNSQLAELGKMVKLLSSIDSKIVTGSNKPSEQPRVTPEQQEQFQSGATSQSVGVERTIPRSSVDLRRNRARSGEFPITF